MDSGSFVDMDAVEAPVPVVEDTIMDVDPLAEALGCAPITRLAVNDHAVAVTCCGRFRAINQDRVCLEQLPDDDIVAGVFDGHGFLGENAALLCSAAVPSMVASGKSFPECLRALQSVLVQIADNEHRRLPEEGFDYGTTAAIVRISGLQVKCAWVGDSRIALFEENARTRTWSWQWSSMEHNPETHEAEKVRLLQSPARTTVVAGSTRVYPRSMSLEDAVRNKLTLNMSRALGHRILVQHGVSPDPDVHEITLSRLRNSCIVIASDGIWDVLEESDVAQILTKHMSHGVLTVAEALLAKSDRAWSDCATGDNMRSSNNHHLDDRKSNRLHIYSVIIIRILKSAS
ncbi:PPM-type phosphatase domain-containing protein [Plasmodiophora brassicae]